MEETYSKRDHRAEARRPQPRPCHQQPSSGWSLCGRGDRWRTKQSPVCAPLWYTFGGCSLVAMLCPFLNPQLPDQGGANQCSALECPCFSWLGCLLYTVSNTIELGVLVCESSAQVQCFWVKIWDVLREEADGLAEAGFSLSCYLLCSGASADELETRRGCPTSRFSFFWCFQLSPLPFRRIPVNDQSAFPMAGEEDGFSR